MPERLGRKRLESAMATTPDRVGVLILHGMGSQPPDFAASFIAALGSRLETAGVSTESAVCQPAYWADVLDRQESELWGRVSAEPVSWRTLRRFVVSAVGDALAYRASPSAVDTTYQRIHKRIADELTGLERVVDRDGAPLVIVGHSLGSVIASDHVWDEQVGRGFGRTPFTTAATLAGMITFGSTLPLFCLDVDPIVPIRFPGTALTPQQRSKARWLNFYDAADVLGYPLRATAYGYECTVDEDVVVDSGPPLIDKTPLSHIYYWSNTAVINRTAILIRELLTP